MTDYANKEQKALIVSMAACVALADNLLGQEYRNHKKAKRSVMAMQNHAQKALDAMMDGLSIESMEAIIRYVQRSEITVLPQTDPRAQKEWLVVPVDVMDRLLSDIMSECALCEKVGEKVKRCKKRKDLIAAGVIERGSKDCPFSGE